MRLVVIDTGTLGLLTHPAAQTILAANAGDIVTIATNNPRHLSRFPGIDARPWQSVTS
jgi:hypothetical protein